MGQETGTEPGVARNRASDQSCRHLSASGVPLASTVLANALRIVNIDDGEGVRDVSVEGYITGRRAIDPIDVAKKNAKRLERGRHRIRVGSRGFWNRREEKVPRQG